MSDVEQVLAQYRKGEELAAEEMRLFNLRYECREKGDSYNYSFFDKKHDEACKKELEAYATLRKMWSPKVRKEVNDEISNLEGRITTLNCKKAALKNPNGKYAAEYYERKADRISIIATVCAGIPAIGIIPLLILWGLIALGTYMDSWSADERMGYVNFATTVSWILVAFLVLAIVIGCLAETFRRKSEHCAPLESQWRKEKQDYEIQIVQLEMACTQLKELKRYCESRS